MLGDLVESGPRRGRPATTALDTTMTLHPLSGKALFLALALSTGAAAPVQAADGMREMMADAMVRMMEAMGMFGSATGGMGTNPMAMAGPTWGLGPGGFGVPGGIPSGVPWNALSGAAPGMNQMLQQFGSGAVPGMGQMMPWGGPGLQGIWEGRNGELLIVQGDRFRIYPGNAGYAEGYLQVSGDRLSLYNPRDAQARPFEYAESEGRLVLRDTAGQVFLYRRLQLNRDATTAPATSQQQR